MAKPLPSRPQQKSSPFASASPLVLALYRCLIGFPRACTIFATLGTPTDSSDEDFLNPAEAGRSVMPRLADRDDVTPTVFCYDYGQE